MKGVEVNGRGSVGLAYNNRRGLTLLEVVITVVILAVIAAIAVPAIQNAREQSRRSTCKNNLKQIGIGLHNYADTYNEILPPGIVANYAGLDVSVDGPTADHVGCVGWSWQTMTIPFIDSAPVFYRIDFSLSVGELSRGATSQQAMNNEAICQTGSIMTCPSDTRPDYVPLDHSDGDPPFVVTNSAGGIASTSYYGNAGSFEEVVMYPAVCEVPEGQQDQPPLFNGGWSNRMMTNGVFATNSSVTLSDIGRDGTSCTIGVGEVSGLRDPMSHIRSSAYGSIGPNGTLTSDVALSMLRSGEWKLNASTRHNTTAAERGFSSEHKGGAQFLFMDGTVQFISENIQHIPAPGLADTDPQSQAGCNWAPVSQAELGTRNGKCGEGAYGVNVTWHFQIGPNGEKPDVPKKVFDHIRHGEANYGMYQRLFSRNDQLR